MKKKEEQKTTTTTTKTKTSPRWSFQKMLDCIAYFGTASIAIALIISMIFKGNNWGVTVAFKTIGDTIAYVLTMILAAFWVKRKKHIAWLICYIVFVVVIIVMYVMTNLVNV